MPIPRKPSHLPQLGKPHPMSTHIHRIRTNISLIFSCGMKLPHPSLWRSVSSSFLLDMLGKPGTSTQRTPTGLWAHGCLTECLTDVISFLWHCAMEKKTPKQTEQVKTDISVATLFFLCLLLIPLALHVPHKNHTLQSKTESLTASEDQYCYHAD